ncbi:MAG: glutamate mutase L [Rhodospirillales bacterium]|nr:glutamate mutase L [Rhodospirillales bacterium]
MTVKAIALADFGSTFTKLTIVEAGSGRRLASAQVPTTVRTDVMEGYADAFGRASTQLPPDTDIVEKLAASSAGGGLRVASVGLVADYTAAAARQAALNAGGKVELLLSGRITADRIAALEALRPEIVLFSGGTDGGQHGQVLDNARAVAGARFDAHVIVACNRDVAEVAAELFVGAGHSAEIVGNVLPEIRHLDIEPARAAIHDAFIERVIRGKGLSRTEEFGRSVIMPTPEAALAATRLLADGPPGGSGVGNVLVVDIGGATTDVHSAVTLAPHTPGITAEGLPPLPVTRSVQGDLGMRWSASGVYEADGDWLDGETTARNWPRGRAAEAARRRRDDPDFMPQDAGEEALDRLFAISCITHALRRHCGRLRTVYVPGQGTSFFQHGLDLREVPRIIGTGGMLVHDTAAGKTLGGALERRAEGSLVPTGASVLLDKHYVLAAAGLLATRDSNAAYALLKKELGFDA